MNNKYMIWFFHIFIVPAILITYEFILPKFMEEPQPSIIVNNAIYLSPLLDTAGKPFSFVEKKQAAELIYHSNSSVGMWNVLANDTHCAASFRSEKGTVAILGNKDSAMLYLEGRDVPFSEEPMLFPTILHQTDTAPKVVRAMVSNGLNGESSLSFAVPSLQAGIEGMLENHHFRVEMEGKTVVDISWENGLFLRHKLQECFKQINVSA